MSRSPRKERPNSSPQVRSKVCSGSSCRQASDPCGSQVASMFPRSFPKAPTIECSAHLRQAALVPTHLSLRDLEPGTLVAGVIRDVAMDELSVDLPFHMRGFVMADQALEGTTSSNPDLRCCYYPGQYIVGAAMSIESGQLRLTMRPSVVNAGLSFDKLVAGMVISVSLLAKEDFGWSARMGVPSCKAVYVMLPSETDSSLCSCWQKSVESGCIRQVSIIEMNSAARSVSCSPEVVKKSVAMSTPLDVSAVRPGMLVEGQISSTIAQGESDGSGHPSGFYVTFGRILRAVLPTTHLDLIINRDGQTANVSLEAFDRDKKFEARVMACLKPEGTVLLSHRSNLLAWHSSPSCWSESALRHCRPGSRLRSCQVISVNPSYSARMFVTGKGGTFLTADVARTKCVDSTVQSIPLKEGQIVPEARVLSSNLLEQALVVTTAPSLLATKYLVPEDLEPGGVVEGTVSHVSPNAVFITISQTVSGILPREHVSDVPSSSLPAKIKQGAKMKCRVLYVDCKTRAVFLTAKKSLFDPEKSLVNFQDCAAGRIVHGVVQRTTSDDTEVLVRFFGDIIGHLPSQEFEIFNCEGKRRQGAVVKCKIVRVNHLSRRLDLSLDPLAAVSSTNGVLSKTSCVTQALLQLQQQNAKQSTPRAIADCLASVGLGEAHAVARWGRQPLEILLHPRHRARPKTKSLVERFHIIEVTEKHVIILMALPRDSVQTADGDASPGDLEVLLIGCIQRGHLSDNEAPGSESEEQIRALRGPLIAIAPNCAIEEESLEGVYLPLLSAKASLLRARECGSFVDKVDDLANVYNTSVDAYVVKILPQGLIVSLGSNAVSGIVPQKFLPVADRSELEQQYRVGQTIRGRVLRFDKPSENSDSRVKFLLDARKTEVAAQSGALFGGSAGDDHQLFEAFKRMEAIRGDLPSDERDLRVGEDYPAVIRKVGSPGVFVLFSPSVEARIAFRELSPRFLQPEEAAAQFRVGMVLDRVRVLSVGEQTLRNGKAAVAASLLQAGKFHISPQDLQPGSVLSCVVKAKLESGLVLSVENSDIDAFCYYKHIADGQTDRNAAVDVFNVGDLVAARVLEQDWKGKKRVPVTLCASVFENMEDVVTLQERLELERVANASEIPTTVPSGTDSELEEGSGGDNDATSQGTMRRRYTLVASRLPARKSECEISPISEPDSPPNSSAEVLRRKEGVDSVTVTTNSPKQSREKFETCAECKEKKSRKSRKREEQTSSVTDGVPEKKARRSRKESRAQDVIQKEAQASGDGPKTEAAQSIRKRDKLSGSSVPHSTCVAEFERSLISQSDSSLLWIRYMAHLIDSGDLEGARCVLERGLRSIPPSKEKEKLNLWIAGISMESQFGDSEREEALIKRALKLNDAKQLYHQLTYTYQKLGKLKRCLQICKESTKHFPESQKVWVRYVECLFHGGVTDDVAFAKAVRDLSLQALKALPSRKHISFTLTLGRLEMKHGSFERGRMYYEKLLSDHYRRTDIWSQYFDALVAAQRRGKCATEVVRQTFERATTMPAIKPRQVEYFFSRWLTFERMLGSKNGEAVVKAAARAYVDTVTR